MSQSRRVPNRVLVLFIVLWALWTARIGAKFYGEQDSFRSWMPAAVRNYEIYDYNTIGLMMVRNAYVEDVENLYVYSHHPPLVVWLPALMAKFAGLNEVSARFPFAAAVMIGTAAFYCLVKHSYGEKMTFWAVFFFGITPFTSYFAPSYGIDTLGFLALLLFAALFAIWLKRPTWMRFLGLIGVTILAAWSAWPAVIYIGVLGIFGLFLGGWQQRAGIVVLGIVSVLAIAAMLVLYEQWWAGSFNSLMEAYFWRSSSASLTADSEPFTLIQWLSRNLIDIIRFGTLSLVVLTVMGIYSLWQYGTRFANAITFSLLVAALVYLLFFRNATYVHHYYKAYLVPVMAIAAAAAVVYGRTLHPRITRPVTDALILVFVAQALFVLAFLVGTTNAPSLTHVIDYINGLTEKPERIIVTYININPGSEYALEYYTIQPIDWTIALDEVAPDEDVLYILCDENQQYVSDFYEGISPPSTPLDELCTAYDLGAG
jgi:4-amino-4-deoxy-L-arabinose transferase-like glycosyltransferase